MAPHQNYEWFFEYWEKHPEEVLSYNKESTNKEILMKLLNGPSMSSEELSSLSEEDQLTAAYSMYSMANLSGSVEKSKNDYDRLFCIKIQYITV